MKASIFDPNLYELWLKEKKNLMPRTIMAYKFTIIQFLTTDPDIDTVEAYNDFIIKHCIKRRAYHHYYAFKDFINYKFENIRVKEKLIDTLIRPPERRDLFKERKYLSLKQIATVINNLDRLKHQIVALIQNLTGVRASDVLRLKKGGIFVEDYNGERVLRLNVLAKRGKKNVVYIHDSFAIDMILNYINENQTTTNYYFTEQHIPRTNKIFDDENMVLLNYQKYWIDLKFALQKSGVHRDDFATHDFRRCFARRFYTEYLDLQALSKILHHTDARSTLRYLEQSGLENIEYFKRMQKQTG